MDYLEKGLKSSELLDSTIQMSSAAHRAHAGPRRSPESSPRSPGGSSSASDHRESRLSVAAALSRAGSVACYAGGFLVAFAALLALPLQAQAQTVVTLVSSSNQTAGQSSTELGNHWEIAQGFTTGSNTAGYTLTNIRAELPTAFTSPSLTVTLHKDAPANAAIATLTNPATIAVGQLTFTAPANTTLDASTTYYVLFHGENIFLGSTTSDDEDTNGLSDWSVEDVRYRRDDRTTGAFTEVAVATPIRVRGTVDVATPTVSISADKTTAEFKEDGITYTLTRTGSTTAALDVSISLSQPDGKDFLLAADLPQTVTIAAGQSTKTFTVAASSFQHFAAGTMVEGGTLTAVVEDEDGPGGDYDLGTPFSVNVAIVIGMTVRFDMASYSVGEAAGTLSFMLIARTGAGAAQPTADYGLGEYYTDATNGTALLNVDFNESSSPLIFPVGDFSASGGVWQAEQAFSIAINEDALDEDDETFDILLERRFSNSSISVVDASGNSCGSVCTVTVTITDDDTAGVTVSKSALTVTEDDTTGDTYTVVLNSQPTANVVVTVAGHSGTDVTPAPAILTFTPMNWAAAQTVTVTAVGDTDTTDDTVTLTHTATSTDPNYDAGAASVTVTVEENTPAEGKPTISGPAQVGRTLTAATAGITDDEGLTMVSYEYEWLAAGTVIGGATSATYTPTSSVQGDKIAVRVTFDDDEDNPETLTSDETIPVAPAAATCPTDAATIWCTTLTVGHYLEEVDGDIEVLEAGYDTVSSSIAYGSLGGATFRHLGVDYTVTSLHSGATQDLYFATTTNLPADGAGLTVHVQKYVGELDVPLAAGRFQSHDTLWFFQGALNTSASSGDALSDAPLIHAPWSRDQVVPDPPDLGTEVMVRLSFANRPAEGTPTISGTAQVRETLTAGMGDVADADGLPTTFPDDYTFQWLRVDADGVSNETPIGAGAVTYTPVAADVGKKIKVQVRFTDDGGTGETLTSDAYPSSGTITAGTLPALSFASANITVNETAGTVTLTVELDPASTGTVTVDYATSDQTAQAGVDYTATSGTLTFAASETSKTITVPILNDTDYDPSQRFRVTLSNASGAATLPTSPWAQVNITNDDAVPTASIANVTVGEGAGTMTLTLELDRLSNSDISYSAVTAGVGGTATVADDYVSFLQGGSKDFTVPAGAMSATFDITLVDDSLDETDETIVIVWTKFLSHDATPASITVTGTITDNDTAGNNPPVFDDGEDTSRAFNETLGDVAMITASDIGTAVGATDSNNDTLAYSLEGADAARFGIITTTGQLRTRAGEKYDFEAQPSYAVTVRVVDGNGGADTIDVTVNVNNTTETPLAPAAPRVTQSSGSTTSLDVNWVAPDNTGRPTITGYDLQYRAGTSGGWTAGPQNVSGTSASLTGLTAGTAYGVQVRGLNDDGDGAWGASGAGRTGSLTPTVRFGAASYTAIEGVGGATVTVELSPAAARAVTVPVTTDPQGGASSADYDGVPTSVTFAVGETATTFILTATSDAVDETGERVQLGFGPLPSGVVLGSPSTATVALVEDVDVSTWYVWFGESSYTVTEGGTARIRVHLNSPWKPDLNEALTVPLFDPQHEGGATADDYSGVPESVTFQPGQTQTSFTVRATADSDDDDGERVVLHFRRLFPDDLEAGRYGARVATLHLADNDGETAVTVSFEAANYTAAEGGATATVRLLLDTAPGRAVTIPLTPNHRGATAGDYTGLPASVTFGASDTVQSFTLTATDDSADDDRESVAIGFGSLPSKVSAGSPSEAVVQLTDNDHGHTSLQVRFDARAGTVRDGVEEGGGYRLGVSLNVTPGQTLTIPLTYSYLGGATAADFTDLPSNVTFGTNATSAGVTIRPVDDFEDDPGEGIRVSFGTLPAGVSVGSWSGRSTSIPVIDNDALPGLSVADASAREWPNPLPCLIFVVTMDRMDVDHEVRVDYATRSGTAVAGQDFTPIAGTLVFRVSESRRRTASKSLCVKVLDDSHDEGIEQMTLVLSNPVRAYLTDGTATGSISNTDPMPRGFLGRFGRTAAVEVIAQVEERIRARRTPGMSARLAGRELRPGMTDDVSRGFLRQLGSLARSKAPVDEGNISMAGFPGGAVSLRTTGRTGVTPIGVDPHREATGPNWIGYLKRGFGVGDLLTGSSFELNRETGHGGVLSFWSRGARSQFTGREDRVTLDGRTATTMAGADYRKGRLVAGLSLAHSRGQGDYKGVDVGALASSVTGLYPWLGYQATDRITVWGVTGFGKGSLRLTPGTGGALETGLSMAMAAAGMRGELVAPVMGGFGMAFKTDALWVATSNAALEGPAGSLAATRAVVTRLRAGLEASRGYDFRSGLSLQPSLEVGLRQDDGNAETGAGVDVAGGLIFSVPSRGIKADLRVRTLLMHQDQDYRERGVLVSFSYDPKPSTPLGMTVRLAPSWGGQARSAAEALWSRETMEGLGGRRPEAGARFDTELAYGLPVGGRLVGIPLIGIRTSATSRYYQLGYKLAVLQRSTMNFELGVAAQRRESLVRGTVDRGVTGRVTMTW